jgi:hypothetical protein
MAHKGASVGRGPSGDGRVWDEDFAPDAFADFDFPRRRITGGKGRSTNGDGGSTNGNGLRANGNGRSTAANVHHPPTAARNPASSPRQPAPSSRPGQGVPGRRTVTIRGYGAERNLPWTAGQSRRRPAQPPHQRPGFRADRAAMWAVLLGIMLVVVAAASSHAAVLRTIGTRSPGRAVGHAATAAAPRSVTVASPRRARGF